MLDKEIFINEFENQEFVFCDVNWWPLIKIQVAYQLHLKNAGVFKLKNTGKSYNEIAVKITLKENLRFYRQRFKRCKAVKNIIVTDSCCKDNSIANKNEAINPYTDPFIDYFQKLKIDYSVFDYKEDQFLLGYDLRILRKVFAGRVKYKFNRDSKIQLQLKQLCEFLSQHYGNDFELYHFLVQSIISNEVEFLTYSFILKKGKVKNILLYCYYNSTMMSIIRAANQLNIATVEYQHSQVTSNHFAYSDWNTIQKNSKDFFPSKIWVWRPSDADYLAKQFKSIKTIKYIVGGNLSLDSSKTIKVKKTDSNIRALVTLQGIGLPDYVISCLDRHPNLILYLRLHPRYPQDKEMCEMLKLKYKEQIEIDVANSLSLHELFSFVDYHLTNYSGSAIEAEYFDVTNIIYGDKGYISYENEIKTKKYLFIQNQEDLEAIFEQKAKHKSGSNQEKKDICKLIKENFS